MLKSKYSWSRSWRTVATVLVMACFARPDAYDAASPSSGICHRPEHSRALKGPPLGRAEDLARRRGPALRYEGPEIDASSGHLGEQINDQQGALFSSFVRHGAPIFLCFRFVPIRYVSFLLTVFYLLVPSSFGFYLGVDNHPHLLFSSRSSSPEKRKKKPLALGLVKTL